jgi:tetratricopeptide (TPR) repeat protein
MGAVRQHCMSQGPLFACAAALLVLSATSTAAQTPQDVFQRKQAFVAAIRQFSISIAGRFGDEGRRLQYDVDAMAAALRAWDESIAAFEQTLRGRRLEADDHVALGSVQLDRYRVPDAVRSFTAATRLDPKRVDLQVLLAMAHALGGQRNEATRALTRAAALEPGNVVVRYELARVTMEAGSPPRSNEVFTAFQAAAARTLATGGSVTLTRPALVRQTAGVAPIFPPAPYVPAFAALTDGRFEDAVAQARAALARDPLAETSGDPGVLAASADLLRRGDVAGALRLATAAVAADPERAALHAVLGTIYRLDDQPDRSADSYSTAIRLRPDDERARLALADVLIDAGRLDDAERALRDAIRAVPGGVLAHYRLGRLLQARGTYGGALTELEIAARTAPLIGQDPLYEMVALLYANQADFAGAISALRKQVAVNPGNAEAHRRLGDSYIRQGRTDEAQTEFMAALLVDPRNVSSFLGLAQLHLSAGTHLEAARAARRAIAIDPSQAQAHYVLGTALTRLGQGEEARREMDTFLRLQTEAAGAAKQKFERDGLVRQITTAIAAAEHGAAVPLLKQLIVLEPKVAAHFLSLGRELAGSNQTREAIEAFQMALALDPSNPDVHRHLAETYLAAGQTDAGRQAAARYRESIDNAKRQRALRFGNP